MSELILILTAILAASLLISIAVHLIRRRRRRISAVADIPSPEPSLPTAAPPTPEKSDAVSQLPLFKLSSALAAVPKSSPDCAVCQSPFGPDEDLRLLPACHHAFHAHCVDQWLRSSPSCPLCRASIALPPKPFSPNNAGGSRSGSFRIEIGRVSSRKDSGVQPPAPATLPAYLRSYSIGLDFEYLVEEELEVEAVVERISRPPEKMERGEGGERSWLREYVDRMTSSASSSFSALRCSGRWSRRYDDGSVVGPTFDGGRTGGWDLEAQENGVLGFYRWLVGAY